MAIANSTQTIIDTNKTVVIKRTGVLDSPEPLTVFINPKTFKGLLNANGTSYQTGNTLTANFANTAFSILRVIYNVDAEVGHLELRWQGDVAGNDAVAYAFGVGSGDTNPLSNLPPVWNNAVNPTGNLTIQTVGTTANAAYTLILELRKNNRYYDSGQLTDPAAFNYGPYGMAMSQ